MIGLTLGVYASSLSAPPSSGDFLLLEDGSRLLLETGDRLLLESSTPTPTPSPSSTLLLETGDHLLLETGDELLIDDGTPYLSGWSYRQPLTVDNTYGPALTNYQIAFSLDSSNFDFSQAKSDGSDLRVTAGDGLTLWPFYLASFDSGGQTAELWANVPTLAAGTVASGFVYAGNSGASAASDFTSTFIKLATTSGTVALFHCDDGSGTSLSDATTTYTGTIAGGSWAGSAGGGWGTSGANGFASGSAVVLSGSSSGVTVAGLLDTPPAEGAVKLWFKPAGTPTSGARLVSKVTSGGEGLEVYFGSGGTITAVLTKLSGSAVTTITSQATASAGQWSHLCVSWGSVLRLMLNGRIDIEGGGYVTGFGGGGNIPAADGGVWDGTGSFPFALGQTSAASGHTNAFAGSISEVEVVDYQPLPEEIRRNLYRSSYVMGNEEGGRWALAERSVILDAGDLPTYGDYLIQEPTVIPVGPRDWRMHFTADGTGGLHVMQATSTDGIHWTGAAPVALNGNQSWVMQDGALYRWYMCDGYSGSSNVRHMTSADGITWPYNDVASMPIVVASGAGGIIPAVCDNMAVWKEGSTYYMLLEGQDGNPVNTFNLYLLTSTDGTTWTPNAAGALTSLLSYSGGCASGPSAPIKDDAGVYHLYYHSSVAYETLSSISHATSTDLLTWTIQGHGDAVILNKQESFGGVLADQIADPCVVDLGLEMRCYCEAVKNPTPLTDSESRMYLLRYQGTRDQLWTDWPVVAVAPLP